MIDLFRIKPIPEQIKTILGGKTIFTVENHTDRVELAAPYVNYSLMMKRQKFIGWVFKKDSVQVGEWLPSS